MESAEIRGQCASGTSPTCISEQRVRAGATLYDPGYASKAGCDSERQKVKSGRSI